MTTQLDSGVVARVRAILGDLDHCTDPVATARLLPREVYTSEEFWRFEKEAIFYREWLCVGHVREVPEPGDQLPLTVAGEPVVLLRDLSGDVRVMSAVCQHRGHPIFDGVAEKKTDTGCLIKNKRMVCPYHNWQYELDGRLVAAPSMTETVPVKRLRETIRLPQIKTEIFHGLVFINFDPDAKPLAPTLALLDEELQTWGLDELVPMPFDLRRELAWNWKLHHDNALEPYHTAYVHRGVHEAAPAKNARFGEWTPGDGQSCTDVPDQRGREPGQRGRRPQVDHHPGTRHGAAQARHVRVRAAAAVRHLPADHGVAVDPAADRARHHGPAPGQPVPEVGRGVRGLRRGLPDLQGA